MTKQGQPANDWRAALSAVDMQTLDPMAHAIYYSMLSILPAEETEALFAIEQRKGFAAMRQAFTAYMREHPDIKQRVMRVMRRALQGKHPLEGVN